MSISNTGSGGYHLEDDDKFKGLIDVPLIKQTEDALFELFDYASQISPPFFALHSIVAIFRVLQYVGPGLCANYSSVWGEDTIMAKAMNIISVFFHLVPCTLRHDTSTIIVLTYSVLGVLLFTYLFTSTYIYKKTATIPKIVPISFILLFSTLGYLGPPVFVNLAGELIGEMLYGKAKYDMVINIVTLVWFTIVCVIFIYIYGNIYIVTIIFKPDSLMSVVPSNSRAIILSSYIVTLLTSIASQVSYIPREVLSAITALYYIFSLNFIFSKGGLCSLNDMKLVAAGAVSGAILITTGIVCEAVGFKAEEIVFCVVCLVYVVSYVCFHFYFENHASKALLILDEIQEDPELFNDYIKSPRAFCDVVVNGFRYGHPHVVNFEIFKPAIELWPDNIDIWIIYGKFTAIYPERSSQLSFIMSSIANSDIKSSLAKHTVFQIRSVLMQRESNFIPQIKQKLDRIKKDTNVCKAKVRYVWDQIIQGNVNELETALMVSKSTTFNCQSDFMHLIRTFPNSKFVARQYSRFLRDVVGDIEGYKEWSENSKKLQKGITVLPDKAHDMGIMTFPCIPKTSGSSDYFMKQATTLINNDTITIEMEDELDENVGDNIRQSIRDGISRLKIPSLRQGFQITALLYLFLIVVPGLFFTLYSASYINNLSQSLVYMQSLSLIRSRSTISMALGIHLIFEHLGYIDEDFNSDYKNNFTYVGQSVVTKDMLKSIALTIATIVDDYDDFGNWENANDHITKVREILYYPYMSFTYYDSPLVYETKTISFFSAAMEFVTIYDQLSSEDNIDFQDIVNTKYMLEPIYNMENYMTTLVEALEGFMDYIRDGQSEFQRITNIAIPLIIVADIIIFLGVTYYLTSNIKREKLIIYNMLVNLPKNVVSQISDGLKMLKKNSEDDHNNSQTTDCGEELNKQEDNLLKIFMMTSNIRARSNDILMLWISCIVFMILFGVYTTLSLLYYLSKHQALVENAPQIDLLTCFYSYDLVVVALTLYVGSYSTHGFTVPGITTEKILELATEYQDFDIENFAIALFGEISEGIYPYQAMPQYIESVTNQYEENCTASYDVPDALDDVFRCWPPGFLAFYSHLKIAGYLKKFAVDNSEYSFAINTDEFNQLWYTHLQYLFGDFFYPVFHSLYETTSATALQQKPMMIYSVAISVVVGFILCVVVLITMLKSESVQKYALELLLMVPENYLSMNTTLSSILAGNFKSTKEISTTRDDRFYQQVISELPDCVFIIDSSLVIRSANKATKRIYGIEPTEVVGKTLTQFASIFKDKDPFSEVNFKDQKKTVQFETDAVIVKEGDDSYINLALNSVNGGVYILTSRDITQTVMYNKLIADERTKSDGMLASILPAKLIPRVQAGEKNISFSVQTASVLFLDVVSFTPWCGSNEAKYIMSTLNRMFKDFDAILAKHPTMTKIKCIGDCYMAAAGIFAEVNQPAVHAKDITEFGLEVIEAVEKINKDIGETLKIRVGINTGGPLVAGVIGSGGGKPTFEILGPTINMAQQMEHHGVPMAVHVSRATYELIYGSNFDIKERGEVEVKQGKVQTYIVTRKK